MSTTFRLNGSTATVRDDPSTPLHFVLRETLGMKSVRVGCALEQCGACKVLCDGAPVYTCVSALAAFSGRSVLTLEALSRTPAMEDAGDERARAALRLVQTAFLRHNAGQCGFCLSGILAAAAALLLRVNRPTKDEVRAALDDHLCRCGAQPRILRAIEHALDGWFA